ncbi:DUF4185 domain-containing protein [Brachybacterium paraconglomeratum]|uniref:DUF4185 domain-containing protein n=1 Tax=Brachybacterium paraconglomeratum TaxID=173362 RepID=UPI003FD5130B
MTSSAHHDSDPRGISRRDSFLALGGVAAAAAGLGAVGLSATPAHAAPSIQRLGEVTGPGRTDRFGANATDLGIPALAPDGRILTVFGDTFDGPAALHGDNRAPIALYSDPAQPLADRMT